MACGACKAFWDDLNALAFMALAQVTLLLFITSLPSAEANSELKDMERNRRGSPRPLLPKTLYEWGVGMGEGTEPPSL